MHAAAGASPLLAGAAALIVNLAVALAIAWLALGIVDALVRHAALARALAMTSTEKREDDRLAGADPRWRARRAAALRGPRVADAIAGASLLVLGDDIAVAIAWDPHRRPIPVRTATGRGPRATQLLGLARRHRVAVHRDPALAAALVTGDGPVPEPHWPRLADVIAATRGRAPRGDARDPLSRDPLSRDPL
jgi:flagellar biosynthetic protein FlhB